MFQSGDGGNSGKCKNIWYQSAGNCPAPLGLIHATVQTFIHDLGPMFNTDLTCDLIHKISPLKNF